MKKLIGINRKIDVHKYYHKDTYSFYKQTILYKYGYRFFSESKALFEKEAFELVKTSLKPKEILDALLDYLNEKRIEVPRYYVFAEVITKSLNLFENSLIDIIDQTLTVEQKEILDQFMNLPVDSNQPPSAQNPYLLTQFKNVEQSLAPMKITESLKEFYQIKNLHDQLSDFFKSNLISNVLINYYAIWILKAEHIQFDAIGNTGKKRLYTTSFITYQYKIRQDYFVDTFLQAVQKYYNDAEKYAEQSLLQEGTKYKKQEQVVKIRKIISESKEKLNEIREIAFSSTGGDSDEKLRLIREVFDKVDVNTGDAILKELDELEKTGIKSLKNSLFYEELEKGYRKLLNRLSGVLQILEFNPQNSNPDIYKAVEHYQQKSSPQKNSEPPLEFLGKSEQKWINGEDGKFKDNLYKVFLFKAVFDHIKAGTLNLLFSERYKSVDDYLIHFARWEANKKELISRAGLEKLDINPQTIIDRLKDTAGNHYKTTNENITDNPYIRFNPKGVARVKTPKSSNAREDMPEWVGMDKYISLTKVLSDIRYCTDYISSFTHYNRKNVKSAPPDESFYAAIIALGCNIGVRKMGKISDGITPDKLEYIVRWFCSIKNIDDANRKILSLIDSLPLSGIYLENPEKLNTSSDGQKYDVTIPSLHASHSPKYFGSGKGVSVYSSIDEKDRLFYNKVIGAGERESSFVLDGLFHNEKITSDTHSTDTHGYSESVFGICYLLDVQFAPRIKNYQEQLLYTFKEKNRKHYENQVYKILPAKSAYINEEIIEEQWDQILRLLCTIKLKESLPSNILKRLSSYSKQNPLYKAIKEVERIYKTIFLLKYYDEVIFRQNIEKQLNRIELSHRFARMVLFGNNQEFKYATKEEQDMAVGCRSLIQSAIILWNYLFISEKLSQITNHAERQKQIELLKNSSMMTWQHVNLHGKYDFDLDVDTSPFDLVAAKSLKIN